MQESSQVHSDEISKPQVDETGWTFLHLAAIEGDKQKLVEFIERWPNFVDQKDVYGTTAIHLAARWGHTSCLEELLRSGKTDINAANSIKWTPLHCASWEGELQNVSLLLRSGCAVNSQSQLGWTPLHFAARWGHAQITQQLIDHNARTDITDGEGLTPAHQAAMMGRKNILKLFNDNLLLNIYDKTSEGKTVIDFAFTNRNTLNFCINMDDKYGMSLLQHASVQGQNELFQNLLIYYSKRRNKYKGIFPKDDFNPLYNIKGRDKELAQMKLNLHKDKMLVVTGISGIGKTALVKSYAWTNQDYYQNNLFWVDAQNQECIKKSFIKIARHLKIATKKYDNDRDFQTIVKDTFNRLKLNTGLLVFDNITTIDVIQNYLVNDPPIDIIIICRNVQTSFKMKNLSLAPIPLESAVQIFEPLFQDKLLTDTDRPYINQLLTVLQCIPLALHTAKMYIIHKIFSKDNVALSRYTSNIIDEGNFEDLADNKLEKIVYSVVEVNLDAILLKFSSLDLHMAKLLMSCSFLNPNLISIRCIMHLTQLNPDDMNYVKIYVRDLFCNINNNKFYVNNYAVNLVLHYSEMQPNFKADCYRNVITLILNNNYSHHHKSILSFARDYEDIIKEFRETKLLQYLTTYGCVQTLSAIFSELDRVDIVKYVKKFQLLHAAVKSGDINTVEFVYQYDNNIKKINDSGHTLIWEAIEKNHTDVLNFLITKGASLEHIDKLNKTPLHRAAFLGRTDIVKLLLAKTVDPNIRNKFQRTPLHYAAMEGHNDVIKELLNHPEINIDARDHYRRSPVFETIRCYQIESLKLFILRGARINTKDNLDLSPIRLAKLQKNKQQLLAVLREFGYCEETDGGNNCSFWNRNFIV